MSFKKVILSLMFVVGLALIGKPLVYNYIITPKSMEKSYSEAMELSDSDIENNLNELSKGNEQEMFDFSQVQSIDEVEPNMKINRQNVIGGLYIPDVNIKMPIMYGATHENMLAGVGTLKPNMAMGKGNFSLAGHNHPNPNLMLAPLKKMEKGFTMYITDKKYIYEYKTDSIEVVLPHRVDVIDDTEDKNELTLVSCYSDDGHDRIIVKGELVEVTPYVDANQELLKAFNDI